MKTKASMALVSLALGVSLTLALAQETGSTGSSGERSPSRAGQGGFGGRGGSRGGRSAGQEFQAAPLAKDEAEKKILGVLQEMTQGAGRGMSAPRDDARLLRMLTESMGAKNVVELGTFHGYSSIWMCLALRTTGGKLTTFEIDKDNAAISRQNFKRAGVESLVTLVEGDAHQEVSRLKEPIDLVFIDADKEGYVDYLNKLLPVVRPGGLIVAHNISGGMADPAFVSAITTNAALETLFLNTGNSGMSASMKKR